MSEAEFDVVNLSEDSDILQIWEFSVIPFVNTTDHAPEHRLFTTGMTLISQNRGKSESSERLTTSNSASDTPQTYTFLKIY